MIKHVRVKSNFLINRMSPDTCFIYALIESGATYDIEDRDSSLIWDTYGLKLDGTIEQISNFTAYLEMKGLTVEVI